MDIVLNTTFGNPILPQMPGGSDDFDRPAADTLGETPGGRAWAVFNSGSSTSVWGTTGNGRAKMKSADVATHTAVVDWGSADGTLSGTLATFNEASDSNRFGLAFRNQDKDNYLYVETVYPSAKQLRVRKVVAGSASVLGTSDAYPVPGDTIKVNMQGSTITIQLNGVTVLTVNAPILQNVTRHGMFAFAGADAEWDSISFTA